MTPEIVAALKNKKLLPVGELDRGFIRPDYPGQVIVSYYEAGKMCDYIALKWGNDAFLGMMHSYANRKTTAEVIQDNLHESPSAFDHDFLAWLDNQSGNTLRHYDEWKEGMRTLQADVKEGKQGAAIPTGLAIRDFYPDYVGNMSDYELTAEAYIATHDKVHAIDELEKYRDIGGTNVDTLKKLAKLEQDSGKPQEAENTLKKLNFLYPEDEEIHERLGVLLFDSGDAAGAVREYQALLTLKPSDTAASHYNLARALRAAHRTEEAKDQVLMALEAAPDYKPAQQLLLQLSQ
jgi:tetratricopeptide (TPR) repeat protein